MPPPKVLVLPQQQPPSHHQRDGGPSTPSPFTPVTPGFFYRSQSHNEDSSRQSQRRSVWSISSDIARHAVITLWRSRKIQLLSLLFTIVVYVAVLHPSAGRAALSRASSLSSSIEDQPLRGGKSWWAKPPPAIQDASVDLQRRDGRILVKPVDTQNTKYAARKHPIPELMRLAKLKWEDKLNRQSKTLQEAVKEYKRRYKRDPPKGFGEWYNWAKENNVQLIDEYDLIEHDLHTHRAFSPASFRARIEYCENYFKYGWRLVIEDGVLRRAGQDGHHDRAKAMERLIQPFAKYLSNMSMWVNGHDTAAIWRSWEESDRLSKLVAANQYDSDANGTDIRQKSNHLTHDHKFVATCPPSSAMRSDPTFKFGTASKDPRAPYVMPPLPGGAIGTFVGLDLKKYMDVCESPQYRHMHSGTSWTWPMPGPNCVIMTAGVHANFGDVRTIIPEQFESANRETTPWSERTDSRLVWRGQTSGPVWTSAWPYLCSHRARLHLLSHQSDGRRRLMLADPEKKDVIEEVEFDNDVLNKEYLDIGCVGPPVQCTDDDGTCQKLEGEFGGFEEKLSLEEQDNYKFVLDVDGNSWSGRFKRLMASEAAVLKATIFTEPWSDWSVPWVHYIPVQVDYSDLWDILAFFRGEPGTGRGAHDEMAKEIALNGKAWQAKYYRWEDLQSYQFRLLLEWGRLYNEGDMDYHENDEEENND